MKLISKFREYITSIEIFKDSFSTLLLRIIGLFLSFIFMKYIIEIYGKDVWGDFFYFEKSLLILTMLGTLGLSTASVKLVSKYYALNDFDDIRVLYRKVILLIALISILNASTAKYPPPKNRREDTKKMIIFLFNRVVCENRKEKMRRRRRKAKEENRRRK